MIKQQEKRKSINMKEQKREVLYCCQRKLINLKNEITNDSRIQILQEKPSKCHKKLRINV